MSTLAPGALLSLESAQQAVLGAISAPLPAEEVATHEALGRVAARPVVSLTALPPWDNSAMDGYAVIAADLGAASDEEPVSLVVGGEVAAGSAPTGTVTAGTAIRVATGARIPSGADAVLPVEQTTPLDADGRPAGPRGQDATGPLPAAILAHAGVSVGGSIRAMASDLPAGVVVMMPGAAFGPAQIALVAGAGVPRVAVHRRPRIAVLATGDELREPGEPLGPAGIPDANRPGLVALVRSAGAEAIDLGIAPDRLEEVEAALRHGVREADAVLVSGGVSVGPYDVVRQAFGAVGRVDLWRVAVQPGKPFAFGLVERSAAARGGGEMAGPPVLLFGLPGNPVSAFVTFELFARPAIRRLAGRLDLWRPTDRAVLGEPVSKSSGRRAFLRVTAARDPGGAPRRDRHGRVEVRLAGAQGSHILSSLAAADALVVIPEADDRLPAGAEVELWWLDRP